MTWFRSGRYVLPYLKMETLESGFLNTINVIKERLYREEASRCSNAVARYRLTFKWLLF
jgi:hypothetical protein